MLHVRWNETEERFETTEASVRPFPSVFPENVRRVAMCDPSRGTCRQEKCTFAHGPAEKKAWNEILRMSREGRCVYAIASYVACGHHMPLDGVTSKP